MIIRRETLQAVLPAVHTDDETHRCNKIQVSPSGAITATDGHVLLSATEHTRYLDSDFPQKDVPAYHGDPVEAVTLETRIVERAIKGTAKKGIPILGCVQLGTNGDGGIYLAATDLEVPTVQRIPPQAEQAGAFPKWDRIIPAKDRPSVIIELAADVLIQLAKAAKAARPSTGRGAYNSRGAIVRIYVPTAQQHQDWVKSDHPFEQAPGDVKQGLCSTCGERHKGDRYEQIDKGNGQIIDAMRIEIHGLELDIVGAVAVMRRDE